MDPQKSSKHSDTKATIIEVDSNVYKLCTPKVISLSLLVIVNVFLVFTISYSRAPNIIRQKTKNKHIEHNSLYLTSTAVAISEVLKLAISLLIELWHQFEKRRLSTEELNLFFLKIKNEILHIDTVRIGLPGILYVVENNLLFIALSNVSVGIYEVTDQFKILTTAIFSVYILGIKLSTAQQASLVCLTIGVGIVEFSDPHKPSETLVDTKSQAIGVSAILLACLISGFAGVYFEKIIKHGRSVSIYIRNVQLAIYGVTFGILSVFITDERAVEKDGFFQGYTFTTWIVIILFALGGVINALVIKYANNILKGFASSISTVLTSVIISLSSEYPLSNTFVLGSSLVIISVFLYGSFPQEKNASIEASKLEELPEFIS